MIIVIILVFLIGARLIRNWNKRLFYWLSLGAITAIVIAPLLSLSTRLFQLEGFSLYPLSIPADLRLVLSHVFSVTLPAVLSSTAILVIGVALGVLLLGTLLAWWIEMYEFPGRRQLAWLLWMPLAMPAYVLAFVWVGLLDYSGVIQSAWRDYFSATPALANLNWPAIRSRGGAIFVMSLSLYPYVYGLARQAFASQGSRLLEVCQSLGSSPQQTFWRVALPMAKPWLIAAMLLVVMETLADYGTMYVMSVDTFTTAIYKSWFALFSFEAAVILALILMVSAFVLVIVLQRSQQEMDQRHEFNAMGRNHLTNHQKRLVLSKPAQYVMSAICILVLCLAFVLPLGQLLFWIYSEIKTSDAWQSIVSYTWHSVLLAALSACLITCVAVVLSSLQTKKLPNSLQNPLEKTSRFMLTRLALMGYAMPGAVMAVGVFVIQDLLKKTLGESSLLGWMNLTLLGMMIAYLARFLAVAYHPIESAQLRISSSIDEAARSLGTTPWQRLRFIRLPLLRPALISALIMVWIDVIKEMPITLMTRPFGWDGLSIRIFELTSEGLWQKAALPATCLVLLAAIPIWWLARQKNTD